MKRTKKLFLFIALFLGLTSCIVYVNLPVNAGRFDTAIDRSVDSIKEHLDTPPVISNLWAGVTIKNYVVNLAQKIVIPIIILIGIMVAILGFYRLMFSHSSEETEKAIKLISYGVIGILILFSAQYLSNVFFEELFAKGDVTDIAANELAFDLYKRIAYPFLKLVIYLSLGGLILILITKVLKYITATDDSAKKWLTTIISWNIIAMFIILWAKQIIEAIYGKQAEVLSASATNLGELGWGVLADKNIPLLYNIINWGLGIATFVILAIIIYQAIILLTKPDDSDQLKKITKSFLYIFAGLVVIGAWYILSNFLIIN